MGGDRYLWSGLVPVRLAPEAVPAIVDWCRSRKVLRPMAVVSGPLAAGSTGLALVHAIEAAGLAVWTFDRAAGASLATVADAVASYHFENRDAVIALGGAVALDVSKATALMSGQRTPYRSLAADPGAEGSPVDASAVAPLLAIPATPAAALSVGAAVWIADETGVARPLRHPALRPTEAILAGDLLSAVPDGSALRSAAVAALIAGDAGVADDAIGALLRPGPLPVRSSAPPSTWRGRSKPRPARAAAWRSAVPWRAGSASPRPWSRSPPRPAGYRPSAASSVTTKPHRRRLPAPRSSGRRAPPAARRRSPRSTGCWPTSG